MLSRFFGERVGGVRFFEELDRAKADPSANYPLLELQHACLALGFEGIHRTSAGGAATLQQIQRNLYEILRRVKKANPELSPRWQGQALSAATVRSQIPVWAVGSGVAALLLAVYVVLRLLLGGESDAAAAALVAVHPTNEIGIQRRVFQTPPPPPPPTPVSWATAAAICASSNGDRPLVALPKRSCARISSCGSSGTEVNLTSGAVGVPVMETVTVVCPEVDCACRSSCGTSVPEAKEMVPRRKFRRRASRSSVPRRRFSVPFGAGAAAVPPTFTSPPSSTSTPRPRT
jgi:hypothetical protein